MIAESVRLRESRERVKHWKRWGPYLAERAWGTVREDYSASGDAWAYFSHDQARSRAYRWNEDGLAGLCDRHQQICFAVALWNGVDPFLKERLFGLTGHQGNHGEDVKECYFYLDSTPTHSWMSYLYRYPQRAFPYAALVEENARRGKGDAEYELLDTGIFDDDRYFDVQVDYAKADVGDILVCISVTNRGPSAAALSVLPTVWYRNTWSWQEHAAKPRLAIEAPNTIGLTGHRYGRRYLRADGAPTWLVTENETNAERLFGSPNRSPWVKDGINAYVVDGVESAVNPDGTGTKAAAHYRLSVQPGETRVVRVRLSDRPEAAEDFGPGFSGVLAARRGEADEFFATLTPDQLSADGRNVTRQAIAGLLWSKQFYHYDVDCWLSGDPAKVSPPLERRHGRNTGWAHLHNADVLSMPDAWEYPWYAAWDLAFHCVALAMVDPDFAKDQLTLLLREWYMHPNGQLPAYEWSLGDANPPVHAWAAWRIYKIERKRRGGQGDLVFLERVFHKLLLNFTWWVNRKDPEGLNVFEGGFLGLDNIGVFNRSEPLPTGGHLEQSDGTSWMAMYSLNMLTIAMELARHNPVYEGLASKFWEHFVYIAHAVHDLGHMWNEEDGFYYDVLHLPNGVRRPLAIRSMVGLIPLFAVETLEPDRLDRLPAFKRRMDWFVDNRPDLLDACGSMRASGDQERRLLTLADPDRLRRILATMLDEREFLSPYGIRSLSRIHHDRPFRYEHEGVAHVVSYEPAESGSGLFGGNSNWRGPVWFPVNFLIIEALQKFHHFLGDAFTVECPTGSGHEMTLADVSTDLSRRLTKMFLRDSEGRRPVHGTDDRFQRDPRWRDLVLFYEYFHGDDGRGLGASHQTGWTALVAKLLQQSGG